MSGIQTIDESRPYAMVYGFSDYMYEQDGRRYDATKKLLPGPVTGRTPVSEIVQTREANVDNTKQKSKLTVADYGHSFPHTPPETFVDSDTVRRSAGTPQKIGGYAHTLTVDSLMWGIAKGKLSSASSKALMEEYKRLTGRSPLNMRRDVMIKALKTIWARVALVLTEGVPVQTAAADDDDETETETEEQRPETEEHPDADDPRKLDL